jgi:hypothetical protein
VEEKSEHTIDIPIPVTEWHMSSFRYGTKLGFEVVGNKGKK